MRATQKDRIASLLLLAIAIAWSVIVYRTIPAGAIEGQIGPRDFPLFLGIILIGLSSMVLLRTFIGKADEREVAEKPDTPQKTARFQNGMFAASVFVLIILYGFLMEKVGFVIATPALIALTLAGLLGLRSPVTILGLAFGLTAACWVIFGQLLGIYLPPGQWITIL